MRERATAATEEATQGSPARGTRAAWPDCTHPPELATLVPAAERRGERVVCQGCGSWVKVVMSRREERKEARRRTRRRR